VPVYVARLIDCVGLENVEQVATGEPTKIGDTVSVADREWRVQKIVDSGIDQIDETPICTPVDGCDYELVLQDLIGSPAEIVEDFHAELPLVPGSGLKANGRPWEVVRIEESGREGVPRLICRPWQGPTTLPPYLRE
jgi:hypothetical protein